MTDLELLGHRQNIYFVDDPHKRKGWLQAVDELAIDTLARKIIGKNAEAFYNKNMGWPVICLKYDQLINE
jgi:hypothetical protein